MTLAPGLCALVSSVALGLALRPAIDHWVTSLGACVLVSAVGLGVAALVMRSGARRARGGGAA
jgi:hypothetical protein